MIRKALCRIQDASLRHGSRYGRFVAFKFLATIGLFIVGVFTLAMPFIPYEHEANFFAAGVLIVKATAVVMSFIAFESLYWKLRLTRLERESAN